MRRSLIDPIVYVAFQWPSLNSKEHGLLIDDFQQRIIRAGFDHRISEIRVKGCAKAGKGCAAAMLINCWFRLFGNARIILTSQRYEHARDNIFGEVLAWRKQMHDPGPGDNQRDRIFHHERHYIAIANPETGEGFSGHHGPNTVFVFDESTSLPQEFYELAQTQARLIILLSNPRTLSGWFRKGFPLANSDDTQEVQIASGACLCVTVGGQDCRNVRERRLEKPSVAQAIGQVVINGQEFKTGQHIPAELFENVKPIIPGQICLDKYLALCANRDKQYVRVYADGKFPEEDMDLQVIQPSWLPRHVAAWHPAIAVQAFGLDVANSDGGDKTILAVGGSEGIAALHERRGRDTMATVGWALETAKAKHGIDLTKGEHPVCVDCDGLGVGVGDRLKERGVLVIQHYGAVSADDSQAFANYRAESYGILGARLDPSGSFGTPWALPNDSELLDELTAPEKIFGSQWPRFKITSKDSDGSDDMTVKNKLGRSPDKGDAVVYLYRAVGKLSQVPRSPGMAIVPGSQKWKEVEAEIKKRSARWEVL